MIDLEKAKLEQLTSVDYTPDIPPSYVYAQQESCSNPSTVKRRRLRRCLRHLLAFSLFCLFAAYLSINTIFRDHLLRQVHEGPSKCKGVLHLNPVDDYAEYERRMTAVTHLPLDAKELYFLAEGSLAHGTFEVSPTAPANSTEAVVEVDVFYKLQESLNDLSLCTIHREGTWGVGIFTSRWWLPKEERLLRFHVHVRLPAPAPGAAPLKLGWLTTDLPRFSHYLHDITEAAYFEYLWLQADNTPIHADYVAANRVSIRTNNAPIRGTFNASSQLLLETTNAPIVVRANLVNGDTDGTGRATAAWLQTTNANIDGVIGLYSNTTDATGGRFRVTAHTAHAPVTLHFVDAPVDSHLAADARTTFSPATVILHPTFEGTFDLSTSRFFTPEVRSPGDIEDPAGRGRSRVVRTEHVGQGVIKGGAAWGSVDPTGKGEVVVQTSFSKVRLDIGEVA